MGPLSPGVSGTESTAAGPSSVRGENPVSSHVPSGAATKISSCVARKPVVGGSSPWIFAYVSVVVSVTWTVARSPVLAGTAGTTLVTLLTTEVWERARDGIASLWRRAEPERAEAVSAEVEVTRRDLLVAEADGDIASRSELGTEWQGRIRRLLAAHPEEAEALRTLLAELAPYTPDVPSVTQHATASGNARVYQAGRDQHFGER